MRRPFASTLLILSAIQSLPIHRVGVNALLSIGRGTRGTVGRKLVADLQIQPACRSPDFDKVAADQDSAVDLASTVVIQIFDRSLGVTRLACSRRSDFHFLSLGSRNRDQPIDRMVGPASHRNRRKRHRVAGGYRLLHPSAERRGKVHLEDFPRAVLHQETLRLALWAEIEAEQGSAQRLRLVRARIPATRGVIAAGLLGWRRAPVVAAGCGNYKAGARQQTNRQQARLQFQLDLVHDALQKRLVARNARKAHPTWRFAPFHRIHTAADFAPPVIGCIRLGFPPRWTYLFENHMVGRPFTQISKFERL